MSINAPVNPPANHLSNQALASSNKDVSKVERNHSLWSLAFKKLIKDKVALSCILVIFGYVLVAILSKFGIIGANWAESVAASYAPPSGDLWLGADIFGRSVLVKTLMGTRVAVSVGLITVMVSVPLGIFFGAVSGYFGGFIDEIITWFYTTLASIPNIMLLISLTFVLGKGITSVYIALGITSWIGLCRMIRGEVMKHKTREYVQAATAIGASNYRKLFIHILPNVFHIVIIESSLLFQTAVKSEVILSFLGLGVQDLPSWGKMIDESKMELARGVWWQLAGATIAMFFLLLSLNLLGDALRDALDPKLKGKD
ncbi:MAG: ABC transporter permease [Bacteriovoracaceae bacterium]|nr:ABC transporter permease [Bacteriovoracaceae bacterium]